MPRVGSHFSVVSLNGAAKHAAAYEGKYVRFVTEAQARVWRPCSRIERNDPVAQNVSMQLPTVENTRHIIISGVTVQQVLRERRKPSLTVAIYCCLPCNDIRIVHKDAAYS